jgi:KDEL-tailed cysteine endopeptidase
MDYAFQYIIQNQGLTTETNYPYEAMAGTCDAEKASHSEAQISNFEDVPSKSEEALLKAVASQPVSVAIDATVPFNTIQVGSSMENVETT